ncbi:MAG: CCE_0567 family metalloprotein [Beijerinckiaceae bacterium]
MADIDALKTEVKKLSARAMNLKMNLDDLSEELPSNWQSFPQVAQDAYDAFRTLEAKRAELKQAEASQTMSPRAVWSI